jgi:hypothetical protein
LLFFLSLSPSSLFFFSSCFRFAFNSFYITVKTAVQVSFV